MKGYSSDRPIVYTLVTNSITKVTNSIVKTCKFPLFYHSHDGCYLFIPHMHTYVYKISSFTDRQSDYCHCRYSPMLHSTQKFVYHTTVSTMLLHMLT